MDLLIPLLAGLILLPPSGAHERAPVRGKPPRATSADSQLQTVAPNDNRVPAGILRGGIHELHLEAMTAGWRPDARVDSLLTVQVFAERGGVPSIPGPLLRVPQGTEVLVTIRNALPDPLRLHGIRAGTVADDALIISAGEHRQIRFTASRPGTFLYWGTTSDAAMDQRRGRDSQLTGAIVVDPHGMIADPAERIFVITGVDIDGGLLDPTSPELTRESAINGLSWPFTEQLRYRVGEKVTWRWINAAYQTHPMHLHGFHFTTLARGDWREDTTYVAEQRIEAVTELILPGGTARVEWTPTRAGRWLVHCHMRVHSVRWPPRPDDEIVHDAHDPRDHARDSMEGLVMGITTIGSSGGDFLSLQAATSRHLTLVTRESPPDGKSPRRRAYLLGGSGADGQDALPVPGPPIVLTRGETTRITLLNQMTEPTTVHWHGMELESVFDGVAGWSGFPTFKAPLLAPGESFDVVLTPPRAGTFIYHTHMDEVNQVADGLYGPLIVLEPGERYDPRTDLVFFSGMNVLDGARQAVINGEIEPEPIALEAGVTYRLRMINIQPDFKMYMELRSGEEFVEWAPLAKDGADLPAGRQVRAPARVLIGSGETYDFLWTPDRPLDAVLTVYPSVGPLPMRQQHLRIR
jgi:manganese oxidase